MKHFLLVIFFSIICYYGFSQVTGKIFLSNLKDGEIKLSQISDTSVRISIQPETIQSKCAIDIIFHGAGFIQTVIIKPSKTNISLISIISNDRIQKRLTVGSKITLEGHYYFEKGQYRKTNLFGSTYTIVAD